MITKKEGLEKEKNKMLLKVSDNRYINRLDIREARIEEEFVWFMDKTGEH